MNGTRAVARGALRLALAAVAAGCAVQPRDLPPPPHHTRLDHVPIAVRDLEAAQRTYRDALGFALKPGRPHANSVMNAHVKFADGSALELITASEPRDAQAERYLRLVAERDGGAALALDAGPVRALAGRLRPLSHPFATSEESYYEALSFPAESPLAYLFFIVVHRRPPDLPEHLAHPNGATRLHAVWLARGEWAAERELFGILGRPPRGSALTLPGAASVREVEAGGGLIYLLHDTAADPRRPVVGATVEVASLERALASLSPAVAAAAERGRDARGGFLRIPPRAAHGMWIELLETGAAAAARAAPPPPGERVRIVQGRDTFRVAVEIAETPRQISTGLMERDHLPEEAGMLFLFAEPQPARRGFWMYRTRIPLDVAFLDGEGRIVAIREMEPCGSPIARLCRSYAPGAPYLAALEVNRGYFAARGIGVGARVVLERAADAPPPPGAER